MKSFTKVIVFQLKNEQYGVDIQQVRSIERLTGVTEVPKTADFIKGVINLRGDITPLIDLKERLHVGTTVQTEATRVLILNIEGLQVGLIVDSATDVIDLEDDLVEPAPSMIGGVTKEYLKGVAKLKEKLLILLDLEKVLNFEEVAQAQEAAN